MKKILNLVLAIVFIFAFSSCSKNNKKYVIDYTTKTTNFDVKNIFNELDENDIIKVTIDDSYLLYRFNGYYSKEGFKYKEYTCNLNYYKGLIYLVFTYNEEAKVSHYSFLDESIFDMCLNL